MADFQEILSKKELRSLDSLPEIIFNLLLDNELTLATAESITGGDIARTLVQHPGMSEVFLGGVVAYSNLSKVNSCSVQPKTIQRYGPVSSQVTSEMAQGIHKKLGSQICIATTGFAGPRKGTEQIGLVFISVIHPDRELTQRFQFNGDRRDIIAQTTFTALDLCRYVMTNQKGG